MRELEAWDLQEIPPVKKHTVFPVGNYIPGSVLQIGVVLNSPIYQESEPIICCVGGIKN